MFLSSTVLHSFPCYIKAIVNNKKLPWELLWAAFSYLDVLCESVENLFGNIYCLGEVPLALLVNNVLPRIIPVEITDRLLVVVGIWSDTVLILVSESWLRKVRITGSAHELLASKPQVALNTSWTSTFKNLPNLLVHSFCLTFPALICSSLTILMKFVEVFGNNGVNVPKITRSTLNVM